MSFDGIKRQVRSDRATSRITFTLLLVILVMNMVIELKSGGGIWFWVYLILTVLYVPLTLMAWFLPDEDRV